MTPEEAIEILELPKDPLKSGTHYHAIPSPKRISYTDYLNARKAAIEALEKQIPKKPNCVEDKMWACPDCDNSLMWKWQRYPDVLIPKGFGNKFCLACGQALDWGEDNDH